MAIAITTFAIYALANVANEWGGVFRTEAPIDLSITALPLYSLYSFTRAISGLIISIFLALILGYLAARTRWGERIIIPLTDIGQSIPVLGFMPGLVLGLISVFPNSNIGIELACTILFVTSQLWNIVFSFYSSLKGISPTLMEVSAMVGQSWTQRFKRIELPSAATGLAWNSLVSMAGGWFFLTVCESFTLRNQNYRLPGLGSYMAAAIDQDDTRAMFSGIIAMITVILFSDFILWRPIIAWTRKFQLDEEQRIHAQEIPFVTLLLRESRVVQRFINLFTERRWWQLPKLNETIKKKRRKNRMLPAWILLSTWMTPTQERTFWDRVIQTCILVSILAALGWFLDLIRPLSHADMFQIGKSTGLTLLRVFCAVTIASLWTLPFGIWVGLSPRLTRFFQPIIQVIASFPAPMIYPFILVLTHSLGITLGFSSILLMLLGIQWYVLFNVLAGAVGISNELRDQLKLAGVSRIERWKKLYLPSIFPALVTGWVTAAGGAWNASIVSEYVQFRGSLVETDGLGSLISKATAAGNYSLLAGCLLAMVATVVFFNRTLWNYLYQLASTKYRFET